ncbi:hypothetical protein [Streptomyces glaucosporus]
MPGRGTPRDPFPGPRDAPPVRLWQLLLYGLMPFAGLLTVWSGLLGRGDMTYVAVGLVTAVSGLVLFTTGVSRYRRRKSG